MQIAGPDAAGPSSHEVTLRKRNALEIAPYALELRHGSSLPIAGGNLVLVFGLSCVLISHTNVRYI
jgi:hypothetical protein